MLALAALPSPVRALYLRTDDKLKPKLDARLACIARLEKTPRRAWRRVAAELSAVYSVRFDRGFSAKNILNLFRDYREHGPEVLMLGYGNEGEKPVEFVNFLARRVENNKRVASVELEAIRAEWFAGKEIPGYGTWQQKWLKDFEGENLPPTCPVWFEPDGGFSTRNLRRYLPGEAAIALARGGFFAAHGSLPQMRNDYSLLRPFELLVFDDVKTDWLISYPGQTRACELWLLVCMDVATRTIIDWVGLASVTDDDGKRAELLERHMKILIGSIITRYGIPTAYPMTLLVENAKATLRDDAKAALATISGGQITVENTRMVNRKLPSGYTERHGTPYDIKAVLEKFFSTFHNHAASLPGQTGSVQMLNAPAELDAEKKEHTELIAACADLPAEIQEQLKLPFLRYAEAIAALEKLFAHLNSRTNHRCQGFDKVELWRFPEDHAWRPIDELRRYPAAEVRRALFHARVESPLERFEKLLRQQPAFLRVPAEALLPFSARVVKKVRHPAPYTIAWTEQGTEFMYRGEVPELASGSGGPFFVKLLPDDATVAYLHDAQTGAFLGTLAHVKKAHPLDEQSRHAAAGEVQHYRSLVVKPIMERHEAERTEHARNTELNAAIIAAARTGADMVAGAAQAKAESRKSARDRQARRARLDRELAETARTSGAVTAPAGALYDDSTAP